LLNDKNIYNVYKECDKKHRDELIKWMEDFEGKLVELKKHNK